MSRVRMSWDWVGDYPIFVYTTFITHFKFHVKLVKGKHRDQNAPGRGPTSKAWIEYICEDLASKNEVVTEALKIAEAHLAKEERDDRS